MRQSEDVVSALRVKFEAVLPHLDERSVRLVLAWEARSLVYGALTAVAQASGASKSRIAQGMTELESGQLAPPGRVRREGGGRKPITEPDPGLVPALLGLVEPTRRGDPESPLSRTTLSTQRLAAQLPRGPAAVSSVRVGSLLKENGFSLQA